MLDRDNLNATNLRGACRASMAVIDVLQNHPPHEQVAGLGACFVLLAEHHAVPLQDAMVAIQNMMKDADGRRPEFKAVGDYLRHEL